jgi:molybdate-binding protein
LPPAAARCDLVIPDDLRDHPVVQILLDALHSRRLGRELASLPGYDASVTGRRIASI